MEVITEELDTSLKSLLKLHINLKKSINNEITTRTLLRKESEAANLYNNLQYIVTSEPAIATQLHQ